MSDYKDPVFLRDRKRESIIGCLLGSAVGDALGLPYEKLSKNRIYQAHTPIQGHAFIFDKGMISDDTEHMCMVAQSLLVSGGDTAKFTHYLAWRLRFWLLGLPASSDLSTLKAIFKLLVGSTPQTSGVHSASNGAVMRSAIIGVCYGHNPSQLLALVNMATIITHSHPKAELGAIAIAVAAYLASSQSIVQPQEYYQALQKYLINSTTESLSLETTAFLTLIEQVCISVEQKESGVTFVSKLANNDRGISSYVYDTVTIVIQVWLRNQNNYAQGVREIIYLGGDTDTTAAILGGIIGASVGFAGIPSKWIDDIIDFPRSINWIESLGERLAQSVIDTRPQPPLSLMIYTIPVRNLLFLIVILFHSFYRLLPPY
jgi:ADP-ribosyl-[dinitrogen reductase] hydrolase